PTEIVRGNAPVAEDHQSELAMRVVRRAIEDQLPPGYVVRWQQAPSRRLWLGTQVHGEMVWFGLAAGMLLADTFLTVLPIMGVSGLAASGGPSLIQRRITRPLQQLIEATGEMAAGHPPRPLSEQAPQEIAALARSFNVMVESLERADRDRALMLAGISH